jgi:thioredoxin-related protein
MRSPLNRVASAIAVLSVASMPVFASTAAKGAELAVFSSAHCPYCLAWEREIGRAYASTEEGQKVPARRLDIDARRPSDLAKIRDVDVTPTFVLVDQGHEVGRIVGYNGKLRFWADMRKLLARVHPQG